MLEVLENPGIRSAVKKIDINTYRKMFEGQKTELIQGVIIEKMSKSKLHTGVLDILFHYISGVLPSEYRLSKEDPITLSDSEPEPDLAIVHPRHSIWDEHPTFAHLVIEISVTTQALDEAKADMYAAGKIPVYWNILPLEKTTVVYSEPAPGGYASVTRVSFDETLYLKLGDSVVKLILEDLLK